MSEQIIGPQRCHSCGGEYGEHSDACQDSPKVIELARLRLENAKLAAMVIRLKRIDRAVCGGWRHSHGMLFCGTLRIAKEDFDTNPSEAFKERFFDAVCEVMNLNNTLNQSPSPALAEFLGPTIELLKLYPNSEHFVTELKRLTSAIGGAK